MPDASADDAGRSGAARDEELAPQAKRGGAGKAAPPLVLVVDDDEVTRCLAREALERAGFSVLLAADGEEALRQQAVHRPDAILLDIFLPLVDGYEVLRRVRSRVAGAMTPIMMMTATGDVEAIERSFLLGATDFLQKPLPLPLLPHRMRYMLRAAAAFLETHESARRLARAQRLARLAHWRTRDGRFEWTSDPLLAFGGGAASGRGSPSRPPTPALLSMVHPDDVARVREALDGAAAHQLDYRIVLPDGSVRLVHHDAEPDPGGPPGALFGAAQDVTEARRIEQQVFRLAFFDETTALPNRELLRRALVATADPVAVVSIDLGTSRIKDALGATDDGVLLAAVDRVLEVVEIDARCPRACDGGASGWGPTEPERWATDALVARVADDELAVLVRGRTHAELDALAARLAAALSEPFVVEDAEVALAAAIGVASTPELAPGYVAQCAHAAMVAGRVRGRGAPVVFDAAAAASGQRRAELSVLLHRAVASLRSAPDAAALSLAYQPKIELRTGVIAGVEALLRWRPLGREVSPDQFIPIAEETGVIVPLGEWVLGQACQQAAAWLRAGSPTRVAVNISARQLRDAGFVTQVLRATTRAELSPALLELEITEHATMQDVDHAVAVLTDLRRLGVQIALDDFGIGYSSLAYLSKLPIDVLKIDRSFIARVGVSPAAEAIPAAILSMAHSLGMRVVAEGVETIAQAEFLDRHGATELQGYLFARPMPATELGALLSQARPWRLGEAREASWASAK